MVPFIDMHCDTLTIANIHYRHDLNRLNMAQVDVERLLQGGARAQFFAICMPKQTTVKLLGNLYEGDWKHIRRLAGILYNTCRQHPDIIQMYSHKGDWERCVKEGKICAFLTIEDGRDIAGDMSRLLLYRRLGVRVITLTWNFSNCFGHPNAPYGRTATKSDMNRGLTAFGKEAVEEMNRLGIVIDVSHLSDRGFWDVAEISKKPFVATHSNCRSICSHPRNLTDEQIRAIAEHGGVIGLNQYPVFLNRWSRVAGEGDCLAHLLHLRDVGGIDCIALGSDFDGCSRTVRMYLNGPQDYPMLADVLLKNGFTQDEVDKIYFRNAERIIKECMC